MKFIRCLIRKLVPLFDICMIPIVFFSAIFYKNMRRIGIDKFKISKKILYKVGVFPIRDHYYEPLFKFEKLRYALDKDRVLPGIDLNEELQLKILKEFHYEEELLKLPMEKTTGEGGFYYNNGAFCSGDAEYLYNMIRYFKPEKILEIGSGHSTLMAREAIKINKMKNRNYECEHICIEPYEMPWLESLGVRVIREKVEELDYKLFQSLKKNDILFIDSSHIIRPQGDVLFEYLEILPILNVGVVIHVHDIFTPKDYLESWVKKDVRLWNEQYVLEAFLTNNNKIEVIGALNYLSHHHSELFSNKCPIFKMQSGREPGSFWMRKK